LAAGVLGVPGLRCALGSLLEDGAVIEGGQGLGEDRLLELARGQTFLIAAGRAVPLP
jgi:hypothetical protein